MLSASKTELTIPFLWLQVPYAWSTLSFYIVETVKNESAGAHDFHLVCRYIYTVYQIFNF